MSEERKFLDSDVAIKGTLIAIFFYLFHPIYSSDFWWHLATGKYIVLTNTLLKTDVFSYTKYGVERLNFEWLGQVIFYLSYTLGGLGGVVLLKDLIILGILIILYRRMSPFNSDLSIFLFFIVFYRLLNWFPLERPRIFTLFFLALFTYVAEKYERDNTRLIWVLPLLTVFWANLHAGWAMGLVLLFLFILSATLSKQFSKVRTYAFVLTLCFVAILITPYGYKTLLYPIQYAGPSIYQNIPEWQPPTVKEFPAFAYLVAAGIVILVLNIKRIKLYEALLLLFFSGYAMYARRFVLHFGIVSVPIIFRYVEKSLLEFINVRRGTRFERLSWEVLEIFNFKDRGRTLCHFFFYVALLISLSLYSIHPHALEADFIYEWFPDDATDVILENQIEGNLFNDYGYGGFCIWKLYPKYKVFVDGRTDLYRGDFLDEYYLIREGRPGWDKGLDRYNVTIVLLPRDAGLASKLVEREDWKISYFDQWSILITRSAP